jgi:hypothetical protein
MKTTADPAKDSTRLALPEMPYMTVSRPAAYARPNLSSAKEAKDTTNGDFRFEKGAGIVQSGWLTLAEKSERGYGTTGQ